MTHICISELAIIGSDNGLSPERCQAIIWTNAGILLIEALGTNFSEIWSKIHTFSITKMHLKKSSVKWHPFCPGLNVLVNQSGNQAMGYIKPCLLGLKLWFEKWPISYLGRGVCLDSDFTVAMAVHPYFHEQSNKTDEFRQFSHWYPQGVLPGRHFSPVVSYFASLAGKVLDQGWF